MSSTAEKLAAARGGDRHVIQQLFEVAREEAYEFISFTSKETPGKDGPGKRRITITIERELDELESIL